jgi:hypothetical protein
LLYSTARAEASHPGAFRSDGRSTAEIGAFAARYLIGLLQLDGEISIFSDCIGI